VKIHHFSNHFSNHFSKICFARNILSKHSKLNSQIQIVRPQIKKLKLRSQTIIQNLAEGIIEKKFLLAVQEKNPGLLEALSDVLEKNPALKTKIFSYKDKQGNGFLHLAVKLNATGVAEVLIKMNHEACFAKNKDGNTPLHLAVDLDDMRMAEVLVSHGAEACYLQNKDGDTPLHLAMAIEDMPLAQKLLNTKPDSVLVQNVGENTPLHLAMALKGDPALIKSMLDQCPSAIFVKNKDFQTPLQLMTKETPDLEAKRGFLYEAWKKQIDGLFINLLDLRMKATPTYNPRSQSLIEFAQELSHQYDFDPKERVSDESQAILDMFARSFKENILTLKIDTFSNASEEGELKCPLSLQKFKVTDPHQSLYYLIPFNLLFCFKESEGQSMLESFITFSKWCHTPFHPDLFINVSPEGLERADQG